MTKKFWEEWAEQPPDPAALSRYTVVNNKYERQDFQELVTELESFGASREKLAESKAGRLAYYVAQDVYLALWKMNPRMEGQGNVRPEGLISHRVVEEVQDLPEFKEVRLFTRGDDIGSALAFTKVEPDLETLYDKFDKQQELADQMEQLMQEMRAARVEQRDLDDMMSEWSEENPDVEPRDWSKEQQEIDEKLAALQARMEETGQSLEEALAKASAEIRNIMRNALRQTADSMNEMESMADAWGMEPGQLHRLPAQERIDLAKRVNKNPKLKRLAELIGAMKRLAFAEQRNKVTRTPEEIFDVELGNSIPRLLPTERGKLADPDRELQFYKQYHERSLMQYEMRGHDKVARGGIIYCHDGSGSMSGDREMWAKAVGLALLHIARKQKRQFVAIQFGSRDQLKQHDFRDGEISPQRVLDFAEFFFGGGTDFESPLNAALKILNEEYSATGALKSDIVFATDGACSVSTHWMEHFDKERERLSFKCWGVSIGASNIKDEPLFTICKGQVVTVQDLTSGDQVRDIFSGI